MDCAFEKIRVKWQKLSLFCCRPFREENTAFPGFQIFDQGFECAFEVTGTAAFQKERASAFGK